MKKSTHTFEAEYDDDDIDTLDAIENQVNSQSPKTTAKRTLKPAINDDSPPNKDKFRRQVVRNSVFASLANRLNIPGNYFQGSHLSTQTTKSELSDRSAEYRNTMRVATHPPALSVRLDGESPVQDDMFKVRTFEVKFSPPDMHLSSPSKFRPNLYFNNVASNPKTKYISVGLLVLLVLAAIVAVVLTTSKSSPLASGSNQPLTLSEQNDQLISSISSTSAMCCEELQDSTANNFEHHVNLVDACGDSYNAGVNGKNAWDSSSQSLGSKNCPTYSLEQLISICFNTVPARLCTEAEVKAKVTEGTGCKGDELFVYTSDKCVDENDVVGIRVVTGGTGVDGYCETDLSKQFIARCCAGPVEC